MPTEKRTTAYGFASPRVLFIGVGAGILLAVLGQIAARVSPIRPSAHQATPTPAPVSFNDETPTPTPTPTPAPTASPSPSGTPVDINAARAAYEAKDYAKAISMFITAVQQAQGAVAIAQLEYELGNAYRDYHQNDQALSSYGLAIAQNPKMVVAYQAKANLLISLNRRAEAKTVLQAGLDANPGNTDLQRDLSTVDLNGPAGE